MSDLRNFLDLDELAPETLRGILDLGLGFKAATAKPARPLEGKSLAMIFEKPSTRTRVSFELGMKTLGGDVVMLSTIDTQLGRGETVADTARVLSRYVDIIMLRATRHETLRELAENATVPVINGLTDRTHPCQIMADVMTFEQYQGPIAGKTVAWVGDGNNMAASFIHAAARFEFELRLACPAELAPPGEILDWARTEGAAVRVTDDINEAVSGADCVVTDTWVSMSDGPRSNVEALLGPYQVDAALMARAKPSAIFMHCLPAKRGKEVTAEVIDGPQSVVWDEAENRLHAQKGILAWCLG